jgi:hypothetical protein
MRKIKVKSFEEFSRALQVFDTIDLADALVDAISRGIKNNNKKVSVCDVEIEEEKEIIRLYSSMEDWPIALNGCMNAYLKTEEYEKCSTVKKLLEEYESKNVVSNK